jgi:hypothetical protein
MVKIRQNKTGKEDVYYFDATTINIHGAHDMGLWSLRAEQVVPRALVMDDIPWETDSDA